ncbi:hypothetical protein ABZP36_033204 [Zizania latifolia]
MGCRSCDKPKMNYRKGLWSPEEDQRLRDYIVKHGLGCWSAVPAKAGELLLLSPSPAHCCMPMYSEWSQIAMHLPGRTDNEVKNYWNSYLKKRVMQAQGSNPNNLGEMTSLSNTEPSLHHQHTKNSSGSTTTSHDQDANLSSGSHGISAPAPAAEPFDHHVQQQHKNFVFSDWMPATGPESYSMSTHWPSSTASSCNVTPSHGAYADQMSGSYGGALQQQQQDHHQSSAAGHGAAATIAGGGYFDLLNMGDIYGGFAATSDDLLF